MTATIDHGRTLLSVEQAAEHLAIGRTTMFGLIKSGAVQSILIGRLRRVPLDALRAYTQRLTTEQNPTSASTTPRLETEGDSVTPRPRNPPHVEAIPSLN